VSAATGDAAAASSTKPNSVQVADLVIMEGVAKVYGLGGYTLSALDGIDLRVRRGEFLAIMGPSGSGKSTLMNIIGCLDRPTRGTYRLDGEDVSRLSEDSLARVRRLAVGFVFQTFNLLPRLTALHNVEVPMVYAGLSPRKRRDRAHKLLTQVGLADRWSHHPSQMSGGERQRVAIARSLANEPALLLADEPTGNLDSRSGAEIVGLLERLHGEGRSVILITHEPEVASHAQRIIHLKDGRIASSEAAR
jgi:putative ABC transport system ATP-binding protein